MELVAHALTCLILIQDNDKAFMHGNFTFNLAINQGVTENNSSSQDNAKFKRPMNTTHQFTCFNCNSFMLISNNYTLYSYVPVAEFGKGL